MKELREEEEKEVKGGSGIGIVIGLIAFGLFDLIAGIIDGYSRPLVCRK